MFLIVLWSWTKCCSFFILTREKLLFGCVISQFKNCIVVLMGQIFNNLYFTPSLDVNQMSTSHLTISHFIILRENKRACTILSLVFFSHIKCIVNMHKPHKWYLYSWGSNPFVSKVKNPCVAQTLHR